ncbi:MULTISPECIES: hypothetical protein [unclassified Veillonella]|uniref:hypothetical protein n=1 Tax=unclassified Veillonella TaxID=2630086 RepID=UPI000F8F0A3B|nr:MULTISPECIES: hypothetical protein [unclassified Veillonella]
MTRKQLYEYVVDQNEMNGYGIDGDSLECAVDIMEFVGGDLYRPLTRLLLSNWKEIASRIESYTDEQWSFVHRIAENMKLSLEHDHGDERHLLSDHGIAISIEMLEGDDTATQTLQGDTPITEEELRRIRGKG